MIRSGRCALLHILAPAVIATVAGCGSGTPIPTQPTPSVQFVPPALIAVNGSITDTFSGAPVGTFTAATQSFPLLMKVEAPGYVSRDVYVSAANPVVDLIPDTALAYYRRLVRNGFERPDNIDAITLRRWSTSPSVYIRTIDDAGKRIDGADLDVVLGALSIVSEVSGGQLSVAAYETGTETREGVRGWVTVKWGQPTAGRCGSAQIGVSGGWIELNPGPACTCTRGIRVEPRTVRHELAHALGFFHTGDRNDLLSGHDWSCADKNAGLSIREQTHMAVAFRRTPGNRDMDSDPRPSSGLSAPASPAPPLVIVD